MAEPAIEVTLALDPEDTRYGSLEGDDGQGGEIQGQVSTGSLIADRFSWRASARDEMLRSLEGPVAWIFSLKIPKDARGRGRGRALFASAMDLLVARGVRQAALSPRPEDDQDRERLIRFYEGFGFRRQGRQADYMVADLGLDRRER